MDNEIMQAEVAESSAGAEVTTDAELDIFDADWDGDGLTVGDDMELETDNATEEAAEADQQEAAETENAEPADMAENTESTEPDKAEEAKAEDQRFVLKHLDEEREVGREEVISLAQKGLDYDRKVPKLTNKVEDYESFIKELAGDLSIDQFMDLARARLLVDAEAKQNREISEADALLKVQADRAAKANAKSESEKEARRQESAAAEEARQKNINAFIAAYPNVKAEDIPASVWADANKTGDLVGAYTRYENQKLKAENSALKQNEKNRARSTGSRKTDGAASAKDPFDAAWDAF